MSLVVPGTPRRRPVASGPDTDRRLISPGLLAPSPWPPPPTPPLLHRAPAPPADDRTSWCSAAVAALLRLPALTAPRHLTFDDGVFGASAVAIRDGGAPFREVFSSQGPLFLPLVRVADVLGSESLNAPRLSGVASGVALTLLVYATARRITDRAGALLAAGLTTTAGSILWVTGPAAADGPALAFSAAALLLALRHRDSPGSASAVCLGLAVGAALATKATALPVLVPVAFVIAGPAVGTLRGRSRVAAAWRHLLLAAGSAAMVWVIPSLVFGLADVWDQSVVYHQEAAGDRDVLRNLAKITSTLLSRDLPVVVFALASGAWSLLGPPDRPGHGEPGPATTAQAFPEGVPAPVAAPREREKWYLHPPDPLLLWAWLGVTVLLLLYIDPLWRPHVAGLIPPATLLIGLRRPPVRVVVALAMLLAPLQVWRLADSSDPFILRPGGYPTDTRALVHELRSLPDGAWVLSDDPGQVWHAGRRTTDDLVDTSVLRIDSGRITAQSLTEAAARPEVCAVVVWSPERFGSLSELPGDLEEVGYREDAQFGSGRRLYIKDACEPP